MYTHIRRIDSVILDIRNLNRSHGNVNEVETFECACSLLSARTLEMNVQKQKEKGKVTNTFEFVEIYAIQQAALMCSKD